MAPGVRILLASLAASLAVACGHPAQLHYEEQLEESSVMAEHGVHRARLVELMRGLDRLRSERLPQAMDVELERARRVREIQVVARAIARSAQEIPLAAGALELDAAERADFARRAEQLQEQAERLGDAARDASPDAISTQFAALEATCEGCHQRYRPAGSLEKDTGP